MIISVFAATIGAIIVILLFLLHYPDVLDIKQLSVALNVSKKTAYKLIQDGTLYNVKVGREYRIPKITVIRYLLGQQSYIPNETTLTKK